MKFCAVILIVAFTIYMPRPVNTETNMIVNPSFEDPAVDTYSETVTGWQESGSGVAVYDQTITGTPAAPDGDQWLSVFVGGTRWVWQHVGR